ncbi:hypothetical protein HDU98_002252 [Podochytrium sp. JEL0797]|nr:hypothetical protein HDU98_002252 [Podochytrium sp. JEL0797]
MRTVSDAVALLDVISGSDALEPQTALADSKKPHKSYKSFLKSGLGSLKGVRIGDKPGVGKTITSLALCHTRPCSDPEFLYSTSDAGLLKSQATVFFVPNNICSQWMQEIKKCFSSNVKAMEIKGKVQYAKNTLKEILEADIVIVSYNFFVNKSYPASKILSTFRQLSTHFRDIKFLDTPATQQFVDSRTSGGDLAFSWIHFHRVVFDEFHEITDKHNAIRSQLLLMSGDSMWGLTGTPKLGGEQEVAEFAEYLKVSFDKSKVSAVEEVGEGGMLDPDKFGSKIRELWSDLADLVTQALNTFGIVTARLKTGLDLDGDEAFRGREGVDKNADVVEEVVVDVKGKRSGLILTEAPSLLLPPSRSLSSNMFLFPDAGDNPVTLATNLATWVIVNQLDADIDWEDSNAMVSGTGEAWLISFTTKLRQLLPSPKYIISHAPQGPYFVGILAVYPNGAYLTVDKCGDTHYADCPGLLNKSIGTFPTTFVFEITAKGAPLNKIMIGKPVTQAGVANTGFITPALLASCVDQARAKGWDAGVMGWDLKLDVPIGSWIDVVGAAIL